MRFVAGGRTGIELFVLYCKIDCEIMAICSFRENKKTKGSQRRGSGRNRKLPQRTGESIPRISARGK